jgi:hypothetical protein
MPRLSYLQNHFSAEFRHQVPPWQQTVLSASSALRDTLASPTLLAQIHTDAIDERDPRFIPMSSGIHSVWIRDANEPGVSPVLDTSRIPPESFGLLIASLAMETTPQDVAGRITMAWVDGDLRVDMSPELYISLTPALELTPKRKPIKNKFLIQIHTRETPRLNSMVKEYERQTWLAALTPEAINARFSQDDIHGLNPFLSMTNRPDITGIELIEHFRQFPGVREHRPKHKKRRFSKIEQIVTTFDFPVTDGHIVHAVLIGPKPSATHTAIPAPPSVSSIRFIDDHQARDTRNTLSRRRIETFVDAYLDRNGHYDEVRFWLMGPSSFMNTDQLYGALREQFTKVQDKEGYNPVQALMRLTMIDSYPRSMITAALYKKMKARLQAQMLHENERRIQIENLRQEQLLHENEIRIQIENLDAAHHESHTGSRSSNWTSIPDLPPHTRTQVDDDTHAYLEPGTPYLTEAGVPQRVSGTTSVRLYPPHESPLPGYQEGVVESEDQERHIGLFPTSYFD